MMITIIYMIYNYMSHENWLPWLQCIYLHNHIDSQSHDDDHSVSQSFNVNHTHNQSCTESKCMPVSVSDSLTGTGDCSGDDHSSLGLTDYALMYQCRLSSVFTNTIFIGPSSYSCIRYCIEPIDLVLLLVYEIEYIIWSDRFSWYIIILWLYSRS